MKRTFFLLLCWLVCERAFCQPATPAYTAYLQNLCGCFTKDSARVASMNDASAVLGYCLTVADTLLRNKAMREKGLFKTDTESRIEFEKITGMDLVRHCAGFRGSIEKLSNAAPRTTPERRPVLDSIAANACRCLERKGPTTEEERVIKNLQDCMGAAILLHFEAVKKQYAITDQNQETLSTLGEMAVQLMMKNCTFFRQHLQPVFNKQKKK